MVRVVPINSNRVILWTGQEFTLNYYLGSRLINMWVDLSSVFTYLVGALVEIRLCLTLYIVTLQSIV